MEFAPLPEDAQEDGAVVRSLLDLQQSYQKPIFPATAMTPMESQLVQEIAAHAA